MTTLRSGRILALALALALCGCGAPNLVVRNTSLSWNGTAKVVRAEVANVGSGRSSAFLVYFDGEEDPVSPTHRPQVVERVPGLAAGAAVQLAADFAPLARPENAELKNVREVWITVDPELKVEESREDDNRATVELPPPPRG